ncbi:MAG: M48 family metallopeptidase [Gammaproteobacteria bacterium]|nr:M48 family metallopeptidase [Gammaproteobacteria bacterium]
MNKLLKICGVVAALAGCAGLPLVSETELESESEAQFRQMRNTTPISTDAKTRSYINCVAQAIVDELEEPYASRLWEVEVFDNEAINAFAMPGGKIGIFTGIFKAAENQDQLGAVIGHEVAHVTQRHSLERVNRELTQQGVISIGTAAAGIGGAAAGAVQTAAQIGLSLPYGRGQESEADIVGIYYMADAGFDPRASVQLWKNMEREQDLAPPQWLSTHPSSDNRIQDLIEALPEALSRYNAAKAAGKDPRCD